MPVEAKPLFRPDVLRARLAGFALTAHVKALRLEHHLSDLVNAAYHITPDEIALLWQAAPPRMPIGGPTDALEEGVAETLGLSR